MNFRTAESGDAEGSDLLRERRGVSLHELPFHGEGDKSERERASRLMAMGQMAATLAHEIRNPLGSMELYCSLLKRDLSDQPELLMLAEQIHVGIKTLDQVISNCLQFAREICPQTIRVLFTRPLLDTVVAAVIPRAEEAGVSVSIEEVGDCPAYVDGHLLQQALINLLLNAIEAIQGAEQNPEKASSSSSSSVSGSSIAGERLILLRSDRREMRKWTVSVSDSGPGIPSGKVDRVFDPFYTTKPGGTGLGLAIVYAIVNAHEGRIRVESSAESGTCVSLEFPAGSV